MDGQTGEYINLKNVDLTFFKFITFCMKMSFELLEKIIVICNVAVILPVKDLLCHFELQS